MTGRLEDLFGSRGLAISGAARAAMFIGCLVMVFKEVIAFKSWLKPDPIYHVSEYGFDSKGYRLAELLLFLSSGLVGLHGAGRSHMRSMRAFVFLLFSSLVFSTVVGTSKLNEEARLVSRHLKHLLMFYDWSGYIDTPEAIEANKWWDTTQATGFCCGLDGYKDWDSVRPSLLDKDAYPASCCLPANLNNQKGHDILYCQVQKLFAKGCRKSLKSLFQNNRFMPLDEKVFYFVVLLTSVVRLYDICGLK